MSSSSSSNNNFVTGLCMASMAAMALTSMDSAQAFSPVSTTISAPISAASRNYNNNRMISSSSSSSSSLKMASAAQDEIAKLKEMAAKARADAARLAKVCTVYCVMYNSRYFILFIIIAV